MKKLIMALFFVYALPGMAASTWHSSTIKSVYPVGNGDFVIKFNDDSASCLNANSPKYYYVNVNENGVTAEGSKKMYAAALSAAAMRKTVKINFDSDSISCLINRLIVDF